MHFHLFGTVTTAFTIHIPNSSSYLFAQKETISYNDEPYHTHNKSLLQEYTKFRSDDYLQTSILQAKHTLLTVAASLMTTPPEVFTSPPMIDPNGPPSSVEAYQRRKRISFLLENGWNSGPDAYSVSVDELNCLDYNVMGSDVGVEQPRPSTYGEITELGARQLFHYMGLLGDQASNKRNVTIADLGCGSGKLLVLAYMELSCVERLLGVELSETRYQAAIQAWDQVYEDAFELRLAICNKEAIMNIQCDDLFQIDLSTMTHIYVASLCFTDEMMERLAKKLIQDMTMTKDKKDIQVIATLKPFPSTYSRYFGKGDKFFVEMSWTKSLGTGTAVHIYKFEATTVV